jgi:hypothetical protein
LLSAVGGHHGSEWKMTQTGADFAHLHRRPWVVGVERSQMPALDLDVEQGVCVGSQCGCELPPAGSVSRRRGCGEHLGERVERAGVRSREGSDGLRSQVAGVGK